MNSIRVSKLQIERVDEIFFRSNNPHSPSLLPLSISPSKYTQCDQLRHHQVYDIAYLFRMQVTFPFLPILAFKSVGKAKSLRSRGKKLKAVHILLSLAKLNAYSMPSLK